jgi:hypothetical protein
MHHRPRRTSAAPLTAAVLHIYHWRMAEPETTQLMAYIPALRCAVIHFGAPALKERFAKRNRSRLLGSPGVTGVDARFGLGWRAAVAG